MKIEVFGPGCPRCQETKNNVEKALVQLGIQQAEVVHVSDFKEMAKRGITFTPALAVDGDVKCTGKIPEVQEIMTWLGPHM